MEIAVKHSPIIQETAQEAADRLLQEDRDRRARSYKVEAIPAWNRHLHAQGFRFSMRNYGPGKWCLGTGAWNYFPTEDAAEEAGRTWIETGTGA